MKNTNLNTHYSTAILLLTLMLIGLSQTLLAQGSDTAPLTAPANDNFANAETISSLSPAGIDIDTTQATGEANEPNHANASGTLHSVWYRWTADENYSVTIETIGTLDTTLAVYTGNTVGNLTLIRANDNLTGGFHKSSRVTFNANAGTTYQIAVAGAAGATGATLLIADVNRAESGRQFDFDGNYRADFGVFRPGDNNWYITYAIGPNSDSFVFQFGLPDDILIAGDYSGDGYLSDIATWRPSTGVFYFYDKLFQTASTIQWGMPGDIPVSGDFDGDDIADLAVWRPSTGDFWVRRSTNGTTLTQHWGVGATDVPTPADYDGDGKTDFAVRRNSGPDAGKFYILRSSDGSFFAEHFGLGTDLTVPGDYDFDGKNDIAVYRQSNNTYYVLKSSDGDIIYQKWGTTGDVPVPGDYTSNPRSAFSVWRPSTGTLYVLNRFGGVYYYRWGTSGDVPISSSSVH